MPFRPIDPLTDRPREPDELRRLDLDLEQDRSGGTIWPWIVGVLGLIVVVTLVYGYPRWLSTADSQPPSSSSPTIGAAPTSVSKVNPSASTPSPTPTTPSPDSTPH